MCALCACDKERQKVSHTMTTIFDMERMLSVVYLGRYASDYVARRVARRKDFLLVLSTPPSLSSSSSFSSSSNR